MFPGVGFPKQPFFNSLLVWPEHGAGLTATASNERHRCKWKLHGARIFFLRRSLLYMIPFPFPLHKRAALE